MSGVQEDTLCQIRNLYRSIAEFESSFQKSFDICLNEGMLLCTLKLGTYTSSEIADHLGLSNSNASKVIKQAENKGLIKRLLGESDKRQMYFALSDAGRQKLESVKCVEFEIPDLLKKVLQ